MSHSYPQLQIDDKDLFSLSMLKETSSLVWSFGCGLSLKSLKFEESSDSDTEVLDFNPRKNCSKMRIKSPNKGVDVANFTANKSDEK